MSGRVTVTVLAVTADRHGDKVTSTAGEITGLWAPGPSSEDVDGRAQVAQTATLYPASLPVPVTAQHRVRHPDGTVWEVDGEPQAWAPLPGGRVGGHVIQLRRTTG